MSSGSTRSGLSRVQAWTARCSSRFSGKTSVVIDLDIVASPPAPAGQFDPRPRPDARGSGRSSPPLATQALPRVSRLRAALGVQPPNSQQGLMQLLLIDSKP